MSKFEWHYCEVCKMLRPFKRWLRAVTYLECLACGDHQVQKQENENREEFPTARPPLSRGLE